MRYLFFVAEFPTHFSYCSSDPRVRRILSLATQGNVVTCIYESKDDQNGSANSLLAVVEVRGIKSMEYEEIDNYCRANDHIVAEEILTVDQSLNKVLRAHVGKTIRADAFYGR